MHAVPNTLTYVGVVLYRYMVRYSPKAHKAQPPAIQGAVRALAVALTQPPPRGKWAAHHAARIVTQCRQSPKGESLLFGTPCYACSDMIKDGVVFLSHTPDWGSRTTSSSQQPPLLKGSKLLCRYESISPQGRACAAVMGIRGTRHPQFPLMLPPHCSISQVPGSASTSCRQSYVPNSARGHTRFS